MFQNHTYNLIDDVTVINNFDGAFASQLLKGFNLIQFNI